MNPLLLYFGSVIIQYLIALGSLQSSTKVDSQLREVYFSVNNRHRPQQSNYIMGSQPKRRSDSDQTVFKIYKGVKTFDFSKQKNLIVTGGKSVMKLNFRKNRRFNFKAICIFTIQLN